MLRLGLVGRVMSLLRQHARVMAFAIACGLTDTGLSLVPPLVVRDIIRALVAGSGDAGALTPLVPLLAGVAVARGLAR